MSKKMINWLSLIDDNGLENIATRIEDEVWASTEHYESEELRDRRQIEIYYELIKIKES